MLISACDGKRLFFRVIANGAGIDHNQIRRLHRIRLSVSHFTEHTEDPLAVRLVLLAAIGDHMSQARCAPRYPLTDFFHILKLSVYLLRQCAPCRFFYTPVHVIFPFSQAALGRSLHNPP